MILDSSDRGRSSRFRSSGVDSGRSSGSRIDGRFGHGGGRRNGTREISAMPFPEKQQGRRREGSRSTHLLPACSSPCSSVPVTTPSPTATDEPAVVESISSSSPVLAQTALTGFGLGVVVPLAFFFSFWAFLEVVEEEGVESLVEVVGA